MKLKDLKFETRDDVFGGTRARHTFNNGFGVSVLSGGMSYSSKENPYEVAILHNDSVSYDTEITDDVLGHQTEEQVNCILKRVELLKPVK